jgi:hypothetical protein
VVFAVPWHVRDPSRRKQSAQRESFLVGRSELGDRSRMYCCPWWWLSSRFDMSHDAMKGITTIIIFFFFWQEASKAEKNQSRDISWQPRSKLGTFQAIVCPHWTKGWYACPIIFISLCWTFLTSSKWSMKHNTKEYFYAQIQAPLISWCRRRWPAEERSVSVILQGTLDPEKNINDTGVWSRVLS